MAIAPYSLHINVTYKIFLTQIGENLILQVKISFLLPQSFIECNKTSLRLRMFPVVFKSIFGKH